MPNNIDQSAHFLISTVVKRSGVKADLIRAWERRYGAVKPTRTEGGHRVYSDKDIVRLKLLNQATAEGHAISQIATLTVDALHQLLNINPAVKSEKSPVHHAVNLVDNRQLIAAYVEKCYAAILLFDAQAIESHLENAVVELGAQVFMEQLLTPFLTRMGDDWRSGQLRPAHEHITTAVIRSMVYILRSNYVRVDNAPRLVISTPIGQLHELGALMAALIAEFNGWHITYLGPNLPAEEIAFAVKASHANAVAISITIKTDDLVISKEIRRLKKLMGDDVALIVGGNALEDYKTVLEQVGALRVKNYDDFKLVLDGIIHKSAS